MKQSAQTRKRVVVARRIFPELVAELRDDNVVLTPHIASSTRKTRTAMAALAIKNVRTPLAGGRPRSLLNPEAFDKQR